MTDSKKPAPRIITSQFQRYALLYQTIPLHRFSDFELKHGKRMRTGKRPLDRNWTTRRYSTQAVIERCVSENRNMGVRMRATDLVIDVDPRNGGTEGLADLVRTLDLDLSIFPRVVTGSGGYHLYAKKYNKLLCVDTLEAFPGVEFKSSGRQVVSAGSIHPDTGKHYKFDDDFPPLDRAPEIGDTFAATIRRPKSFHGITGGGQYDQEGIANALAHLDITNFGDNESWFKVMCACHHASNGDARPEFIEWSTSDPKYADDAEMIGRRWDSLHREKPSGITYQTLNALLIKAGASHATAAGDAAADFAFETTPQADNDSDDDDWPVDDDEFEAKPATKKPAKSKSKSKNKKPAAADDEFESSGDAGGDLDDDDDEFEAKPSHSDPDPWLDTLNSTYTAVLDGSKFRIIKKDYDPVMKRYQWLRIHIMDFMAKHSKYRVTSPLDPNKVMELGAAWLKWPKRNDKSRIVFDPTNTDHKDSLNLYVGWALEANPKGEWSYLREMLFEALCGGNEEYMEYVLNWAAHMIQSPAQPAESAIVFKGGEGVGKGTWGNALAKITGQHGMAISSPDLLTGRFNAHFQDLIFLFADEAIKAYDKTAESKLKAIITEKTLTIEGKGRDAITAPNYLHVMMASNSNWVVQASMDARRFFVLDATDRWHRQFSKWEKLYDQLRCCNNSGYAALLSHLQTRKLPANWNPGRNMPHTGALVDQKLQSLSPLQQFFFDRMLEGDLKFTVRGDWEKESVWFFRQDFRDSYSDFCRDLDVRFQKAERGSGYFLLKELADLFPAAESDLTRTPWEERTDLKMRSDGRAKAIALPCLRECRSAFESRIGGKIEWETMGIKHENWER